MCDPTLFLIAGTLITAGAQVQAGTAARAVGNANARVQQFMADQAREIGEADVAEQKRITAAISGKQAAGFGAGGGEINTGGAVQILADTAQFGELDVLRIRNNAERQAFALESGAAISRAEGKNAEITGFLSAAGTLVVGGSTVASRWKVFKKETIAAGGTPTVGSFLGFS